MEKKNFRNRFEIFEDEIQVERNKPINDDVNFTELSGLPEFTETALTKAEFSEKHGTGLLKKCYFSEFELYDDEAFITLNYAIREKLKLMLDELIQKISFYYDRI